MTILNDMPDFFQKNKEKELQTETEILAAKAAAAIADLTDTYLAQVEQDILVMHALLKQAAHAKPIPRFHAIRDDFFVKVHDLKGQGATFGYPLLTDLGAWACDYLRQKKEITDKDLQVLTRMLADIETVYQKRLTNDGGDMGIQIRQHLEQGSYDR